MKRKRLPKRAIDLFSGCGGMSLGFQNAGFEVVAAFDNWAPAVKIHQLNFPNCASIQVDLESFSARNDFSIFMKYKPDLIFGGPPCQDFSHAGKRNEHLGRGRLTISFAKIVSALMPYWFVMENVDRTLKTDMYKKACRFFKRAGYGLTSTILDASHCGVPQKRKRLFLVGELKGDDNALMPYINKSSRSRPMTVKDYFGEDLDIEHYYRHPRNYNRRGVFSVNEPSPTVRGVNRPVPPNYPGHAGDSAPHSKNIRALTTIERSYLQTFPKTYLFDGNKTVLEQLIGNAVPVKLAEYVACCIVDYIRDSK